MHTLSHIILYLFGLIETVLGLRFFLRVADANESNGIIRFLYVISDGFLAPFRSIFPKMSIEGSVFEWSTLTAMVLYAILGSLIVKFIAIVNDEHDIDDSLKEA